MNQYRKGKNTTKTNTQLLDFGTIFGYIQMSKFFHYLSPLLKDINTKRKDTGEVTHQVHNKIVI